MKFLILLFAFIAITCTIFPQTTFNKKAFSEHRMNVRKAANYYLRKKINPSPEFSVQYTSLFSGLQGYTRRDTLLATKLINKLHRVDGILFYRLMRIRLEWEFKQHFARSPLDAVRSLLKNNIDSAKYHYMLSLYFQDSITEHLSRKYGFVRATYDGNEVVDRRKMKDLNWRDPKTVESIPFDDFILNVSKDIQRNFKFDHLRDSSILYYKMALDNDPTEFHYLKELILFLSNLSGIKDEEIQQVITSKMENYTDKEKKWLKKYLHSFYERPKK
jgi:hypothetical protein